MFSYFSKMAYRNVLRFKAISLINLASLAFGFCCFISASLLSSYLNSFDQSFPHSDRIYTLLQTSSETGMTGPMVAAPVSSHLRARLPHLDIVRATSAPLGMDVAIDGENRELKIRFVEEGFFNIFPLPMLHGLPAGSDLPPDSVVISEKAAQRVFGTTDVVGRSLRIAHQSDVTIVGVTKAMSEPSHIESALRPLSSDLIAPISVHDRLIDLLAAEYFGDGEHWGNQGFFTYILFPPNHTLDKDAFQKELDSFVREVVPPPYSETLSYQIQPINTLTLSQVSGLLGGVDISRILFIAGCLVGLIGAINYSNLVVAQLSLRSQEIGVQKILGSKRALLVLQYSYETLLFVVTAILIALVACYLVINALVESGTAGISKTLLFDPSLWISILVAAVLIVAFAAAYPAFRTSQVPLVSLLNSKGSSGQSGRVRSVLTGTQFMVSGALIILSLVMLSQNKIMTQQLDGAVADPKVVIRNFLPILPVDLEVLASEFKKHPGVLSVTTTSQLPWTMGGLGVLLSRSPDAQAPTIKAFNHLVGHDFMATVDMPLIAGRDFDRDRANDVFPLMANLQQAKGPYSAIIDRKTAEQLGWQDPDQALGQIVYRRYEPPEVSSPLAIQQVIVGIAGEKRFQIIDVNSFGMSGDLYTLQPDATQHMMLRISLEDARSALNHIDAVWKDLIPGIPLERQFVDELFYENYLLFLRLSSVVTALTVIGLFLAGIGLLGNALIVAGARQKEIAVRKVMGATSLRLFVMLLIDFCKPVMLANLIAWPVAYLLAKFYVSLFAEQSTITLVPFVVSLVASIAFVCMTVFLQAWQSAKARPATVLQYE